MTYDVEVKSDSFEGKVGLAKTLVMVTDPVPSLDTKTLVTISGVVRNVEPFEVSVTATAEVSVDATVGAKRYV